MATRVPLFFYYSGGVANSDPALSIGGGESSGKILQQTATRGGVGDPFVLGCTIESASGNAVGAGMLAWNATARTLQWTDSAGRTEGAVPVDPYGVESFVLNSTYLENQLVVWCAPTMPATDQAEPVVITNNDNNLFPDISEPEAISGVSNYRGIYVKNPAVVPIKVVPYTRKPPTGTDQLLFGWDDEGATLEMLPDGQTPPSGVSLIANYSPYDERAAVTLAPGESRGFWIAHTVPEYSPVPNVDAVSLLGFMLLNPGTSL